MKPKSPNVLIIMTDQHRSDYFSCLGTSPVPTPHLDAIARQGVLFTNAYCPYPVCVASRMSFLTGQYPHTTGAITNRDHLDWRYRTIAHHFHEHGYLTGLIGKMHFGTAHNHGFDYYMSANDWLMYLGPKVQHYANEIASHPLSPQRLDDVYDTGSAFPDLEHVWEGERSPWVGHVTRSDFRSTASALDAEDHLDMFVAREALKFAANHREEPFLLIAGLMKPHVPFFPPREWADRYPIEAETLPEPGSVDLYPAPIRQRMIRQARIDEHVRRTYRAGYHGNLAFADHCIGYLMDSLARNGLLENTIVVYTSDHGEMDGDHGMFQKFSMFDPAAKVPLIVSYPGVVPQGATTEALAEYIGLYPTLCELAGLPLPQRTVLHDFPGAPEGFDGRSFADVCRDPSLPGPEHAYCEYNLRGDMPQYMVRTSRHKYVHNVGSADELYDLQADPGERVNLAGDVANAGLLREMKERLRSIYDPAENPFRSPKR